METAIAAIGHALGVAFAMFWRPSGALILGFALSGVVQAVVSKRQVTRLLPDDSPRTQAIAPGAIRGSHAAAAVSSRRPTPS